MDVRTADAQAPYIKWPGAVSPPWTWIQRPQVPPPGVQPIVGSKHGRRSVVA